MKKVKSLIIFIPSIENAGVEKNLYIIANYLAKKKNFNKNPYSISQQKKI